ncbi:hypothetical protein [Alteribacillus iranensis]|uniref:Uncharacterized protein n=1 Tax=Alteribacillus iranensis TaxID=930128 RepID=A0A1I2DMY0_9BACI|nr:hypothetical protein [Alteribacillus iranensis]SFE81681.1 hypothetical protein SAMN05192532_104169 [Alteribacillus iranensis]
MASYEEFLEEKSKIDELVEKGYRIGKVEENLSGAFVDFERPNEKKQSEKKQLHILNPDTRKYFSNLLIAQQKNK